MHRWMWLGAAAGAALLLNRPSGRRWLRQTADAMRDGYASLGRQIGGRHDVESWVEDAVTHRHPDTTMARAFEEAVQPG